MTKSAYIRHIAPNVSSADILEVSTNIYGVCLVLDGDVGSDRFANSSLDTCAWHWMDQILRRSKSTYRFVETSYNTRHVNVLLP